MIFWNEPLYILLSVNFRMKKIKRKWERRKEIQKNERDSKGFGWDGANILIFQYKPLYLLLKYIQNEKEKKEIYSKGLGWYEANILIFWHKPLYLLLGVNFRMKMKKLNEKETKKKRKRYRKRFGYFDILTQTIMSSS